ncbi:MAG: TonB-dependent receptor, partial [Proteobacteria bacterium]|nr:TonB-dependent receptor [Pseudomonadota bacterium]
MIRAIRSSAFCVFVSALAMAFSSSPALAQDETVTADQDVLPEVVVTAQKREQSLRDVPVSVSVISGDTVNDYLGSAENIRALAGRVPSLQVESSNGRTQPRFYIRGQGNIDFDNNANQPVSMVFDDIALENNVLRSLPLFDIARVEVLKGPQGSLFGRNTNAGIVKIDSVRPSFERNGYAKIGFGSRGTISTEFAAGDQIGEGVAARISLKYQERDNWIDNTVTGPGDDFGAFDEFAYRVQFLFEPSDTFTGLLKLHGFHQGGTQPQVFYANAIELGSSGLRSGFDEEVASHDGGASVDLDHFGGALNLQWEIGERTFTSITGYDTIDNFQSADVDGGLLTFDPANIGVLGSQVFFNVATGDGLDDHYQFTQEFRLSGQEDKLFYQVGLYYFDEDIDVLSTDFELNFSDIVSQQTTSYAIFGQVDYAVNDVFSVIVGGRYTSDDKDLRVIPGPNSPSPADTISVDDDFFNWDVAFIYDTSDDMSWFGRIANGSRGPVTLGRFGFTSSAKTETSTSFELGFKSTLLDGRARWNAAVYAFNNDDQQLTATGGAANVNQLLNADKVKGSGFETDFEVLITDDFLLMANMSYNHTEIDDPNLRDDLCGSNPTCTGLDPVVGMRMGAFGPVTEVSIDGNPLPRTPEWLFNLILQYTVPLASGSLYFNTDWNYRDESNIFLHRSVEFVAEDRWLGGV